MKKIHLFLLCTLLTNTTFPHNIFEDVRNKNKEALKQRLENCENCAIKDEHGNNALHIAAQKGDTEIIDILTTAPSYDSWSDWLYACFYAPTLPYIDEQNDDGDSPLLCATEHGQLATADQLVHKGARMEILNNKGLSAPFLAVFKDDPRFIRVFVAHNLNLTQHKHKNQRGDTIFHTAIRERKPQSITYCAQETSLHNVENDDHKTPTFLAIDTEDDVLKIFTKEQLNAFCSAGIKPIHYAARHNKYDAIAYLLNNNIASINEPDTQGNTPIFYANNETTLNFLLERKADLNKRNNKGEDILAVATHNKNHALIAALTQKHNMDIDARDNNGQTSFMRATIEQNHESMNTLINLGANIRITDNARENVLHKIARNGNQKSAKIVLNHDKALLTDLNKNGDSPAFVAIQNGNITFAEFLIDAGSPIDTINNNGDTIVHELTKRNNNWLLNKLLKKINSNLINHKNKNGECPLSLAVYNDDVETIKALSLCKANMYIVDTAGNNIAHIAAKNGKIKVLTCLQSRQDLFKSHNNHGETPFTYGAQHGQLETIKLLLTEDHFINGDVVATINKMSNKFHLWDNEHQVYEFLLQRHKNRLNECQHIIDIADNTNKLIKDSNNLSQTLSEKTFQRPYHPESLYSYYSEDDLYKMTQTERIKTKNIYLERQNRALITKKTLEQKLHAIVIEEQRKKQTEEERIATQQKTTVAEQKAELERITAERARIQAENERAQQQQQTVMVHGQPVPKEYFNYPVQEDDEDDKKAEEEELCFICVTEQGTRMSCTNCHKGSARICKGCLDKWNDKQKEQNKPATCPTCREPLTK
jgi:ankyrin repeat protein